jgi:hypothetical protein
MSMEDLRKAFKLIEEHSERARFVGPRPPELVRKAEVALGIAFPPTFREFVLRFGAGGFAGQEFFGITSANFETSTVPNGVWLTLDNRKSWGLPEQFVIVSDLGDGAYYAIDVSKKNASGENPVVLFYPGAWDPKTEPPISEVVAEDFGAFLLEQVQWGLEGRGVNPSE